MIDFRVSKNHSASIGAAALAGAEPDGRPQGIPGMVAVWSLIRRRYRVILLGCLTGVGLSGLYGLLSTPQFESQTQILVMGKNPLPAQGGQSPTDLVPAIGEDLLATHMQILVSPQVVQDGLTSKRLDQLPSVRRALDEDQDPDDYVIDQLRITRGGEGQGRAAHVINLSFRHTHDEDCASILKSIVESYDRFLDSRFQGGIGEAASLIQEAKNEIEADLDVITAEYETFREGTSLFRKGKEILNVHLLRLETFETQLASIRLNQMETKSRLEMIKQTLAADVRPGDGDLSRLSLIGQSHTDQLLLLLNVHQDDPNSQRYNAAHAQRAKTVGTEHDILLPLLLRDEELGSKLGPDHPKRKRNRHSIDFVKAFLAEKQTTLSQVHKSSQLDPAMVFRTYHDMLKNDLAELTRRADQIEALVDQEEAAARLLVSDELRDEQLNSRRNRTLQLYDVVLTHVRDIDLAKGYGEFVTEVIAPVEIGEKVSPKPVLLLTLGAMLGVCLGGGLAVVVDHTDRTFCGDEDIRCTLGLPVLAHLTGSPKIDTATNGRSGSQLDPSLVAYHRPASPEAEVFCGLRTLLTHGSLDQQVKTLQVTSPTPGDGKTTVAANLAIALARAGKRVLLVDADMRRPRLAERFGLDAGPGLATVLAGEATVEDIIQQTGVARLSLAPCGPRPASPSELLTGASLDRFLQQARQDYDMVLLDSPALIAVSDSMEIASRVDSVLLTIHVQNNSGDSALRARDLLSSVGANVLGVVVNDPSLQMRQESGQPDRSRVEFWKAGRPWSKPRTGYYADADADSRSPQSAG